MERVFTVHTATVLPKCNLSWHLMRLEIPLISKSKGQAKSNITGYNIQASICITQLCSGRLNRQNNH